MTRTANFFPLIALLKGTCFRTRHLGGADPWRDHNQVFGRRVAAIKVWKN
jgi:hypothetical protein